MFKTLKNIKWIIITSLICIILGVLTFFTFINRSFIDLTVLNLQVLLGMDLVLVLIFFILIFFQLNKVLRESKKQRLGKKTSFKYLTFFTSVTLIPSFIIAFFSLIVFNFGLERYFDSKITSAVNNSYDVAKNYVEETRNAIEADVLLTAIDVNNQSNLYYDNPNRFLNVLTTQRILRKIDEIYLLDSSSNILLEDKFDKTLKFISPPEEAFTQSILGKPIRITDALTNRTSALLKLNNFIDTYLYIVRFMDPQIINYLKDTEKAVNFYYNVQNRQTGIKITFALIYLVVVTLLLFLSVTIALNFGSRLTLPIINLIRASEKIGAGDLNTKVPDIDTDEELKKLNENFNSMIVKLKNQQDKLLLTERYAAWENVARKLAHEIKNPLTPIQLSIDRIKEKYLDKIGDEKKDFANYLNTINKQIKDIEFLVNEFSDFARMPKPEFKKMNLYKTILNVFELNKLSEESIEFIFSKKNEKVYINGDEEQINRVFLNLFKNSIESINEKKIKNVDFKGKIDIDINEDSDYIYVTVKDNGIGFDHLDKDKMLKPYFTTKKKGTGLGLAVVVKILSDHNSLLSFNSTKTGAEIKISFQKFI